MNMKKIGLLILSMTLVISITNAQNKTANSLTYKTAAGVRIWNGGGLTLKTFLDEKNAAEFIGFFGSKSTRITGLYEIHGDLNTETNLKWYIGPGAHVGFYKAGYKDETDNNTLFGIDGVVGLDYKFKNLPFNISLDWQPSFEFRSGFGFNGDWGGLSARYTF